MKKKFAIPTANGELCAHFGHCQKFAIIEVDDNKIVKEDYLDPPGHEPGSFPRFLSSHGVDTIIAGGMGMRAQELFTQNNIEVCVGVQANSPKELVQKYLDKELRTGENLCDH